VPIQTLREEGEGRDGERLEMGRKKNGKGREGRKGARPAPNILA